MGCLRSRLKKLFAFVCLVGLFRCEQSASKSAVPSSPPIARGDTVVVERSAAVFFQGMVMSAEGDRLKVQAATDGELVTVAQHDAYRVGSGMRQPEVDSVAICRVGQTRWEGARVLRLQPGRVLVEDARGDQHEVAPESVIVPTAVTHLNIQRHLEHSNERRAFVRSARAAGKPRAPRSWRPELDERVVANRGRRWLSGRVSGIVDGGVRLAWDDGAPATGVRSGGFVPTPPHEHVFSRGDFGLMEPASAGDSWELVRVDAVDDADIQVRNSEGVTHRVTPRQMLPLAGGP